MLDCSFIVIPSLLHAVKRFVVLLVLLSLKSIIRFVLLTSVRHGLRRHSRFCFFFLELHISVACGGFLSPPFLKRFQF